MRGVSYKIKPNPCQNSLRKRDHDTQIQSIKSKSTLSKIQADNDNAYWENDDDGITSWDTLEERSRWTWKEIGSQENDDNARICRDPSEER